MEQFFLIWFATSLLVGLAFMFGIIIDAFIIDFDEVLSDKNEMLKAIFMFQYAIYVLTKDCLKTSGIVILIVLATVYLGWMNVVIAIFLLVCFVFRFIGIGFYKLFKKG